MSKRDLSTDPANLETMWKKARKIYLKLKLAGLSNVIIAAVLGNIAQESSFDHNARVGKHSGYFGNLIEIENWIIKNFGGYTDTHQTNYLIAGLTGKLPDIKSLWGRDLKNRFDKFIKGITKNTSVAQATKLWEASYEKSGGQELLKRINYANYFYNQILNENKQVSPTKKSTVKQKNKIAMQLIPQINYPQEVLTMELPLQEYVAQTNYTGNNLPLFFDFKDYQFDLEPVLQNAQLATTEFDLPLFATNYKNGGKLIKRGLQGMKVVQTTPYNAEIYLEKESISHPELQTYIQGLDPEERMDAVVQLLTPQYNPITNKVNLNNTYQPTVELQNLKMHYYNDPAGEVMTGLITLPFGSTAIKYTPKLGQIIWGAIKLTMKNPKPFLKNLFYDTGAWMALNEGTRFATGKTLDLKLNWNMGFPEDKGPAFLLTGTAAGIGRRLIGKGANLIGNINFTMHKLPLYLLFMTVDPDLIPQDEMAQKLINRIAELKEKSTLNVEEIPQSEVPKYLKAFKDKGFNTEFEGLTPMIVGKINMQKEPTVQAAVNMLNYRIHNKLGPADGINFNKLMPNYLFGVTNGSTEDFIGVTTLEDYINLLGQTSSVISTISSIKPSAIAASVTTPKTKLTHIGSGLFRDILHIIKAFFHENIGHGLNKFLTKVRNPKLGSENMREMYKSLIDGIDDSIIKVIDPEGALTPEELEATLLESLPEFLLKFALAHNITEETLLEKSISSPEWLDSTFDKFINEMDKKTFTDVITNSESYYSGVLENLLPGNKGLAYKCKMFNFLPKPPEFSVDRDIYDLVYTLRLLNTPYTEANAESYMNMLKNIIGKGFSISALLSTLYNTQDENLNN